MDVLVKARSGFARGLAACAVLCAVFTPSAAHGQSAEPQAVAWREIESLAATLEVLPETGRTPPFAQAGAARDALAKKCRSFLSSYPGAAERFQAVRYELRALFERDCLVGGDFSDLCARAEHFYAAMFPADTRAEAAYWRMLCARRGRSESQPSTLAGITAIDPSLAGAAEAYLQEFPRGPRAAQMLEVLFTAAEEARDAGAMSAALARLGALADAKAGGADAALRASLSGRLKRASAIGKPFRPVPGLEAGQAACLLVLHRGDTLKGRWLREEMAHWQAARPNVRLVRAELPGPASSTGGVVRQTPPAAASQSVTAHWLELPPATAQALAEQWQVTEFPLVFAIDRQGVLRAVAGPANWVAAAEQLEN